jgi:hypothetical protein
MDELLKWSDPSKVRKNANKYLGKEIPIYISSKKDKKYMVQNPDGKWIHFGQLGYQDYTRHGDETRKNAYNHRASHIKGKWKDDKYSPNNLSIHLLWS